MRQQAASSGHSLSGTQVFLQIPLAHLLSIILPYSYGRISGSVEQTFSIRIYKENQAPVFEFEGSVITEINLEFR